VNSCAASRLLTTQILSFLRLSVLESAATPVARAEITHGRAERAAAGCPIGNGAVTSAVLVHLRVEPAHFDWRWRERPVLALLGWEALARDPLSRLRRIQVESTGTTINFRPAAITHRDIGVCTENHIRVYCAIESAKLSRWSR
jgi:hypothetical protein